MNPPRFGETTDDKVERYHRENQDRWRALEEKVDGIASILKAIQLSASFTKWFVSTCAGLAVIGGFFLGLVHPWKL